MDILPQHITGTPPHFDYHPFWFIDFKEHAYIRKQPANFIAPPLPTCGAKFFMDFGFMWASAEDYKQSNKSTDRIVYSLDHFCTYLAIVDGASMRLWCFLTKTKEPAIHILCAFLFKFSCGDGCIRTDQGGELAVWNFNASYLTTLAILPNQLVRQPITKQHR